MSRKHLREGLGSTLNSQKKTRKRRQKDVMKKEIDEPFLLA
jgi:hypothetical protein